MMIHIIQNDPDVPPGTIERYLPLPYTVHHPWRGEPLPAVTGMGGLIVLGGSMGGDDDHLYPFLKGVREIMEEVLKRGVPLLGICLGAQLLAMVSGGSLVRNRWGERGVMSVELTEEGGLDPLFRGIGSTFVTFQWHHDSVDLPSGATLLACSRTCPTQAFRVGDHAWGLQFHPELTEEIISSWCGGETDGLGIVTEFSGIRREYDVVMERLMGNFTAIIARIHGVMGYT